MTKRRYVMEFRDSCDPWLLSLSSKLLNLHLLIIRHWFSFKNFLFTFLQRVGNPFQSSFSIVINFDFDFSTRAVIWHMTSNTNVCTVREKHTLTHLTFDHPPIKWWIHSYYYRSTKTEMSGIIIIIIIVNNIVPVYSWLKQGRRPWSCVSTLDM